MMKAKEIKEIRGLSVEDLGAKLNELKKDLFMLRMQHATNHLDNPTKISAVRRDIARVKTVLREKQNRGGKIKWLKTELLPVRPA